MHIAVVGKGAYMCTVELESFVQDMANTDRQHRKRGRQEGCPSKRHTINFEAQALFDIASI